jgi:hypothetical protein
MVRNDKGAASYQLGGACFQSTDRAGDISVHLKKNGAHNRIRTGDLFLTKELLYLLSYVGA